MKAAILYYTHGLAPALVLQAARAQLVRCKNGDELVSVSQSPLDFGDVRIVMPIKPSVLAMFRQILAGLEATSADTVFMAEHDVIYHPSHFEFVPPRMDCYYYNTNVWMVDFHSGKAIYYDGAAKVSGLVASRELLLEHYRRKIAQVERDGFSHRAIGYEPGRKRRRDDYEAEHFQSRVPNLDIKHAGCVTRGRFSLDQYSAGGRRIKDTWTEAEDIFYWGRTGGRMQEFLQALT